jgi:hypothetical protein
MTRYAKKALENSDVTRGTADLAKDLAASCGSARRFSRASLIPQESDSRLTFLLSVKAIGNATFE